MMSYRILLQNGNGDIKTTYQIREGEHYSKIKGDIPLELREISKENEKIVKDFKLNKLELKIYI